MNWTLIAVLAILVVCSIIGLKKGFIKVVFSMLAMVVVIILTTIFAPKLASCLRERTEWDEKLAVKTETYLDEKGMLAHSDDITQAVAPSELPLPKTLQEKISSGADAYLEKGVEAYNHYVVTTVSGIVFTVLVYAGMLIVILLLVGILYLILNACSKLPVIKQINGIGGLLLGLVQGLLLVWILFVIITVFSTHGFAAEVYQQINRNAFLSFLYDKNILLRLILHFV